MKNFYINKNLGKTLTGLLMLVGLGSCTVYSQGQQYPSNNGTVYNQPQPQTNYDNYDNSYDDGYNNSNEPEISYNNFYSALSPYGSWTNYGSYGQVWVCSDPSFRPYYSNGSWVNTNLGWSWNSGYSWGWAPFHYGRWGFASNLGWYWVPGYQWAPAWVYWGNASNNYAWAPVGPGMNLSVNISIGSIPTNHWTYLPGRYMGYSNMNRYYVPVAQNNVYIRNTTIINNYNVVNNNVRYSAGPRAADVSRFTGRPVNTVRVVQSNNASNNGRVSNGQMSVYRPGRNAGASNDNNSRGRTTQGTTNTQGNNNFGRNNPTNNNNAGRNSNEAVNNNNNNNNRGGFGGRTSTNNTNTTNPTNTVPTTNNNDRGTNNPNWTRGNSNGNETRNSTRRTDGNQPANNTQPTTTSPTTGTNSPTVNRPTAPTNTNSNSGGTQTRWGNGNWNRGSSNSGRTTTPTQQPATNNSVPNRQQNTVPQQQTTAPATNTNRGGFQQNTQRSTPPATTTRPATQTRTENFNGGKFGRGSSGGRR